MKNWSSAVPDIRICLTIRTLRQGDDCGAIRSVSRRTSDAADDHLFPDAVSPLKTEARRADWTERFEIFAGQMGYPTASANSTIPKISAGASKHS
jgi:hypothetical protein